MLQLHTVTNAPSLPYTRFADLLINFYYDLEFFDAEDNEEVDNLSLNSDDTSQSDNSDHIDDYEENVNEDDIPLFPGSPLSIKESVLSILALVLRFSLPGVVIAAVLKLIAMHCPEQNNCKSTLYKFKKYFEHLHSPLTRHFYCSICFRNHPRELLQCPHCLEEKK